MEPDEVTTVKASACGQRLGPETVLRKPRAKQRRLDFPTGPVVGQKNDRLLVNYESGVSRKYHCAGVRNGIDGFEASAGLLQSSDQIPPLTPGAMAIHSLAVRHPGIEEEVGVVIARRANQEPPWLRWRLRLLLPGFNKHAVTIPGQAVRYGSAKTKPEPSPQETEGPSVIHTTRAYCSVRGQPQPGPHLLRLSFCLSTRESSNC